MKYIIDAYGWIAYLDGGKQGDKVNEILKEDNEIYVVLITIAEVISKVERNEGNSELAYMAIIKNAKICELTPKISKDAGLLHAKIRQTLPNFGLADALILTTAKKIDAKIITGDAHFKNFKEAILL